MDDQFYYRLEQEFRGDRELILRRLREYDPFLLPLAATYNGASCIDLGCGRGEWLQLLSEYGFNASGVDADASMIQACHKLDLKAAHKDALGALQDIDSNSQAIVSGFHIAEHLEFEILRDLLTEALRVLAPGGLLILETPNPENIRVASLSFHLDPTHKKPIPPQLLEFLVAESGFHRHVISRLNHEPTLVESASPSLHDVLTGASPDYAVIAQKKADKKMLSRMTDAFDAVSGITTDTLSSRYDETLKKHLSDTRSLMETIARAADEKAQTAEQKAQTAEQKAQTAEQKAQAAEAHASSAADSAAQAAALADAATNSQLKAEAELLAIRQSLSWRMTHPFRVIIDLLLIRPVKSFRHAANTSLANAINAFERPLANVIHQVWKSPRIGKVLSRIISKLPHLHSHLRLIYHKHLFSKKHYQLDQPNRVVDLDNVEMNRAAQEVYADLKRLIEKRKT